MLRPGRKFYKHPSLPMAVVVILTALLAVPTTLVLTVRAQDHPTTESAEAGQVFGDPVNLGPSVNSSAREYDPSVSADELELYFNSPRPGGLGQADIWVTTRKTKADPWGTPVNLGPTVNSPAGEHAPSISADGLSLYFSSDRSGGYGFQDLWMTTRQTRSSPWGEPVNLGPTVNSQAREHAPSISSDGLELYFSGLWEFPESSRPGGLGGSDIWVTRRNTKSDPWGTPVNLGPIVNSPAYDESPSISGDGLSLYFQSYGPGGYGTGSDMWGIWVTRRKSTSDPWGIPMNLGPTVNSANSEINPDISRDGCTLYFVSNRPGGVGGANDRDIWRATLTRRPEDTPDGPPESMLGTSLHQAAAEGDLEQVKQHISEGADVNATAGESARTPLIAAAQGGHAEIVKVLLASGARVDMRDARRLTPLIHAILSHDNKEVVKALVAGGADVNQRSGPGLAAAPALSFAVWRRCEAIMEVLLEAGADVDAKDKWGYTPLHYAAFPFGGHKEVLTQVRQLKVLSFVFKKNMVDSNRSEAIRLALSS